MAVLVATLSLLPAAGGQAPATPFAGVTFTTIITDPNDYPGTGFYDIQEVALAEVWDDVHNASLILRFTVEDWQGTTGPAADESSVQLYLDAVGGHFVGGLDAQGNTAANAGAATPLPLAACWVEGNMGYCLLPFASIGLSAGSRIEFPYSYSYLETGLGVGPAQDRAPGGLVADGLGLTPMTFGDEYMIQGPGDPNAPDVPAGGPVLDDNGTSLEGGASGEPADAGVPGPSFGLALLAALVASVLVARRPKSR